MTEAVTLAAVKREVVARMGVSPEALTVKLKRGDGARARKVGMYLARHLTTRSNGQIARQFGVGHPSSVIYAIREVERMRGEDPALCGAIRAMAAALGGEIAA